MIIEIIGILLAVVALASIINGVEDYCKHKKMVNMSFKEAMDLVEMPIVTFYNNGNKFNFLLDTGSNKSVINSGILNNLKYEKLDTIGTLFGVDGNNIDVSYIRANLEYKNRNYIEDFQVVDMTTAFNQIKSESGVQLSGILGSLFFKKYQYILDFESLIAYSKK